MRSVRVFKFETESLKSVEAAGAADFQAAEHGAERAVLADFYNTWFIVSVRQAQLNRGVTTSCRDGRSYYNYKTFCLQIELYNKQFFCQ